MSRISVIIPTYQHAGTIAACLESLFAQTVLPAEIIVVNDGSTDGTEEVLVPYLHRITLINQENRRAAVARNRGFQASTGDFVIFCDADVRMRPDMLQTMFETLEAHPTVGYAYSAFRFGWKGFSSYVFDKDLLRRMNFIHTTALIRRSAFPGYDEALRRFQDWDLWLTMLESGWEGVYVPEQLFVIDNHPKRQSLIASFAQAPSEWRPSFFYRIPWKRLGWIPRSIQKYEEARKIISQKHNLPAV